MSVFAEGIRFFVFSWDVHLNGSVELRFHSTTCSKPLVNGLYLGESCPQFRILDPINFQRKYPDPSAEKRQWQVHLEGVGNPILRGLVNNGPISYLLLTGMILQVCHSIIRFFEKLKLAQRRSPLLYNKNMCGALYSFLYRLYSVDGYFV